MSIEYDGTTENLKARIVKLSLWLWGNRVKEKNIEKWLKNFDGLLSGDANKEKEIALILLSQFMFYDLREVRQALKSIFKDLYVAPMITAFRKETDTYSMAEYDKHINIKLNQTRFLGVGNPSESSSLLLYFFRQKNNIPKDYFTESCQLLIPNEKNSEIKYLVYIDDISGSGDQAIRNLKPIIKKIRADRKSLGSNIDISYFTLFATTDALRVLRESEDDNSNKLFNRVDCIFELDSTYKVFSNDSRYLVDNTQRSFYEHLCKKDYFEKCKVEDYRDREECGYGDSQLMLGFFYNIPNNTLPIFWSSNELWNPLFRRYNKKYRLGI